MARNSLMCLINCIFDNLIKGVPKGKVLVEVNFNSQDNKTPKEQNFYNKFSYYVWASNFVFS